MTTARSVPIPTVRPRMQASSRTWTFLLGLAVILTARIPRVDARPIPCRSAQFTIAGAPIGSRADARARRSRSARSSAWATSARSIEPRKRRATREGDYGPARPLGDVSGPRRAGAPARQGGRRVHEGSSARSARRATVARSRPRAPTAATASSRPRRPRCRTRRPPSRSPPTRCRRGSTTPSSGS